MRLTSIAGLFLIVTSAFGFAACNGDDDDDGEGQLPACPSAGTSLTYDNFGKQFFTDYCVSCHFEGTTVKGAEPYDTQSAIQAAAEDIYGRAGGTNTNMPQSGAKPTSDERNKLAEWLSCGAK